MECPTLSSAAWLDVPLRLQHEKNWTLYFKTLLLMFRKKIMNAIKKQRTILSGQMMQGICMQWFIDNYSNNKKAIKAIGLYAKILRYTFGYRNRFNYIHQARFDMFSQQLKTHRDHLTSIGVLEWKSTKQMTYYRILEPASEISTFVFTKKDSGSEISKEEKYTKAMEETDKLL
jgi:hypothetical protein